MPLSSAYPSISPFFVGGASEAYETKGHAFESRQAHLRKPGFAGFFRS